MPVNTTITIRKGTSSQWSSTNPVLASGEPGYDLSNNILKIGDGVSNWNSLSNHKHSSIDITNFNSSVSGLLPVTNILSGSNIAVSQSGTAFTVAVTGSLGLTTEEVDDRVSALLVAGSGISINYNDPNNTLTISSLPVTVIAKGYEVVSSPKTTFTVSEGYSIGYLDVYFNGTKLINALDYTATNGSSFTLSQSTLPGDTVEWVGINSYSAYIPNHTHTHTDISNALTTLSQFSSNQNDLALGSGGIIRISSSGALNITGFVASSGGDARLLSNVGSSSIMLKHNDNGSSANNRILCVGSTDFEIQSNGSAAIYYDDIDNKWRVG